MKLKEEFLSAWLESAHIRGLLLLAVTYLSKATQKHGGREGGDFIYVKITSKFNADI